MFAPLSVMNNWSNTTGLIFAFIIGIGFGFALERAGFGNAKKLAMQFYFRDLTVFKVMFTAVITAMTGMIFLNAFGWLDLQNIFINPAYIWPGVVGGLIMGVGFATAGYCPGTSFVGLATFKIDALFYLIGATIGMFVFGEIIPFAQSYFSGSKSMFWGNMTIYQTLGVSAGVVGFFVVLIALAGFWGSEWVEKKYGNVIHS